MDLEEAIYTRRAVRHYTGEPVDEKTIEHWAKSWMHTVHENRSKPI